MTTTLHRHDPGGPTAHVDCQGDTATATWHLPEGQLLADHPELGTGGYVYFTLDATPEDTLPGAGIADFSGTLANPDTAVSITASVEPGVAYRAHFLAAYEDGPAWHNDTVFTCEAPTDAAVSTVLAVSPDVETLPFTGVDGWLIAVAVVLAVAGILLLHLARRLT